MNASPLTYPSSQTVWKVFFRPVRRLGVGEAMTAMERAAHLIREEARAGSHIGMRPAGSWLIVYARNLCGLEMSSRAGEFVFEKVELESWFTRIPPDSEPIRIEDGDLAPHLASLLEIDDPGAGLREWLAMYSDWRSRESTDPLRYLIGRKLVGMLILLVERLRDDLPRINKVPPRDEEEPTPTASN